MTTRKFKLYPEERHWWSFSDYGAVVDVVRRLKLESGKTDEFRVVEFGPGSSTLALIEGGATHVDTFETDPHWADVHAERLGAHLERVDIRLYDWSDPLQIDTSPFLYDLAFVDGPVDVAKRPVAVRWCLEHAQAVLVPADNVEESFLWAALADLADEFACLVEHKITGPLAGAFVLLLPGKAQRSTETVDVDNGVTAVPNDGVVAFTQQEQVYSLSKRAMKRLVKKG